MNILIKKSLLKRILTYQIIIGIVPILFLGITSIISMNNVLENEAIEFQEENVRQGTLYIDLVMDDVESLIANLSGIDEVNDALRGTAAETSYEKLTAQAKIGYILSGYTNLKGLVSIDLFAREGAHYHVGETLNATNINEGVLNRLISETQQSEVFVNWSGIERNINLDSKFSSVITATKILSAKGDTLDNEESQGLLVVSYDPGVFEPVFGNGTDTSNFSIILDEKNRILYHPDSQYIGNSIADELSSRILKQRAGFCTQNIEGQEMLVVFDGTQKGNWTVAKFIPLKDIVSNANTMTTMFAVLLFMSVAVTGLFGLLMSRQVIQPIKMVTDTFRRLQSGDFTNVTKMKLLHQDEIGELGNLFNSFIDAREDITTQKKLERQLNQQNRDLQEALEILKAAQTQMVQQEKMAGIGQLAAGVAHEINNPLGYVTSNCSILRKYISRIENLLSKIDDFRKTDQYIMADQNRIIDRAWEDNSIDLTRSDLNEIVSDTQEGLHRIAEIVNALKTFSRTSLLEERAPYDLNEGIKTTLLIANNEIKYSCTVNFEPGSIPMTTADGGQINQVLLNILINAAQAIKQKQHTEKGLLNIKTYFENDFICCEIQDNGCGMKEDVMNRVFEPFFTTKEIGQGTGLGLSIAYDIIVNKHGGMLTVNSQYGVGTTFKVSLPVNQNKAKDE